MFPNIFGKFNRDPNTFAEIVGLQKLSSKYIRRMRFDLFFEYIYRIYSENIRFPKYLKMVKEYIWEKKQLSEYIHFEYKI